MDIVEMPTNIATRLIDLLVGVRVGILWRLVRVVDEVASRHPMDVLDTALKLVHSPIREMASARMIEAGGPWAY